MARLTRVLQKVFGESATAGEIGKFGSLAAGLPVTTTDPAQMQSLANWLDGWYAAIVGSNSPAIEDMNAVHYVMAYQLKYIFQAGIPEWLTTETYDIGAIVQDGTGEVYISKINSNIGNALGNNANWKYLSASSLVSNAGHNYLTGGTIQTQLDNTDTVLSRQPTVQKFTASSGTYTTPANVKYIRVRMAGAGGGGAGGKFGAGVSNNGINGSASTFGTSLLTANGGQGGQNGSGGTGGTVTVNAPAINTCSFSGGAGNQGDNSSGGDLTYKLGGAGGSNCFGGAGVAVIAANGTVGASNTGAGGGGGSGSQNAANGGGGGGSGGYIDAIITSPSATYLYSVGLGGTGGANDTNGGAGASGIIVVEEYYV